MSISEYDEYTNYLSGKGFRYAMAIERYKSKENKEERFNILGHVDKGILVTAESRNGKIFSSRAFFQVSTIVNGEPIRGDRADAFIDMLVYDNLPCHDESGQEVARLFNYNVKQHGIQTILEKLENPDLHHNNPWIYFNPQNIDLLKQGDNRYNLEKINISKINKFSEKMKIMVGYKQPKVKNPELF
ncbi:MAG TPA: hypothetical protein VEC16_06605 [Alphaproteobacteria bacterium]|nr:hypothetical protein [Alphaproteobacteria bacterium]